MHVFSGFSRNGFIVYGENIYKEYNRKKIINFVAAWIWQKPTSEEKLSQKVPVKGLPPSLYENLLFSCDCAMFFQNRIFYLKIELFIINIKAIAH